jgi:trigger factor
MQTAVETINTYSRKLKVEISADELASIEQKVVKSFQKRAEIPGFRPGKAPLNIIRQRHRELIKQELVEEALRKFYGEALDKTNLNPIAQGKITDFHFENIQNGMQFEIEVEVEPEIELKKYKGLRVDQEVIEVTNEMVENAMQQLQEQFATVKEVKEAKENHYIYFDAQELDKGDVPVIGHKYENLHVQLGSGKFDPEMEKQLIGIKKGDKRIVRKESQSSEPQKKEETGLNSLEIHVKKIEEKEFPEINDDFIKNLNDDRLENLQDLKVHLKENIRIDLAQRRENIFRDRLIDELLKENPSEVPPSMVENYLDSMIRDIKSQSKNESIDENSIRKEYRASAIHSIRWFFLKKKIIEEENLTVSDEEALKLINESNIEAKTKQKLISDQHYLKHLKEDLIERKVIDILKNNAEIIEVYPYNNSKNKKITKS